MCTRRLFSSAPSLSVSACLYPQYPAVRHRLGVPSPRAERGRSHSRHSRQREARQEAFGSGRSEIGAKVLAPSLPGYNNMLPVWTKSDLVQQHGCPCTTTCTPCGQGLTSTPTCTSSGHRVFWYYTKRSVWTRIDRSIQQHAPESWYNNTHSVCTKILVVLQHALRLHKDSSGTTTCTSSSQRLSCYYNVHSV